MYTRALAGVAAVFLIIVGGMAVLNVVRAQTNAVVATSSSTVASTAGLAAATTAPVAAVAGRALTSAEAERAVGSRVHDAIDALARRDGKALAELADPAKGVRFSPYAFVQPAKDQRLSVAELERAFVDPTTRIWGTMDGRGGPIELTFSEYTKRYIWSRDFAAAPRRAYNAAIGRGNTIDNTANVYPDAIMFEAYDPGTNPSLSDVQWQSLRLFFERDADRWCLIAVVHAEWTI